VFCRKIVIAVIALSIGISILGDAKSLYVIARHHTAQFDAWNIEAPGCPTPIKYQASYALSHASDPAGVAIDNDSAVLFITSEFDEGVELVDATNMEPLGWAPGAKNLAGIDIDDRNNIVYAVQRGTGNLYVYAWDPTARTLTLKEGFPKPLPDCGAAFGLALDEIRGLLYVADNQSGLVRIYDTATLTEVSNFAPSIPPVGIAVDRRRQLVYVTAPDASCGPTLPSYTLLCKYDLATEVETTVDMGHGGMGIAVDEVTGYVYVTGGCNGDDISVWDSNLNFVYSTGPIGGSEEDGGPAGIAIGNVSYNPLKLVKNDTVVGYGVYIGQQFTYSITFGNSGDSDITGVQVIDTLPLELDFVAETLDGAPGTGVYDPVTHTVTWDVGTLTPGSTGQIELVVRVNQNAAGKTIIYNYCTIESDQTPPTTVIGEDPDNPSPGEPGTYIIVNQPPDTKIETADIDPVKGTATFTWSGTDDTTPAENLVYSYRLAKDSVYTEWSPWSSATSVTYTDLEPGNYRFQVRTKDADGSIDGSPASWDFEIGVHHTESARLIPVYPKDPSEPSSVMETGVLYRYFKLLDDHGNPIPGAEVYIKEQYLDSPNSRISTTDDEGIFSITLSANRIGPPGSRTVVQPIEKIVYNGKELNCNLAQGEFPVEVNNLWYRRELRTINAFEAGGDLGPQLRGFGYTLTAASVGVKGGLSVAHAISYESGIDGNLLKLQLRVGAEVGGEFTFGAKHRESGFLAGVTGEATVGPYSWQTYAVPEPLGDNRERAEDLVAAYLWQKLDTEGRLFYFPLIGPILDCIAKFVYSYDLNPLLEEKGGGFQLHGEVEGGLKFGFHGSHTRLSIGEVGSEFLLDLAKSFTGEGDERDSILFEVGGHVDFAPAFEFTRAWARRVDAKRIFGFKGSVLLTQSKWIVGISKITESSREAVEFSLGAEYQHSDLPSFSGFVWNGYRLVELTATAPLEWQSLVGQVAGETSVTLSVSSIMNELEELLDNAVSKTSKTLQNIVIRTTGTDSKVFELDFDIGVPGGHVRAKLLEADRRTYPLRIVHTISQYPYLVLTEEYNPEKIPRSTWNNPLLERRTLGQLMSNLAKKAWDMFAAALGYVKQKIEETVEGVTEIGRKAWKGVKDGFHMVVEGGKDLVNGAKVKVQQLGESVKGFWGGILPHSLPSTLSSATLPNESTKTSNTSTWVPVTDGLIIEILDESGVPLDKFDDSVDLSLSYSDEQLADAGIPSSAEKYLQIFWWNSETSQWEPVQSTCNAAENYVEGKILNSGLYVVGFSNTPPHAEILSPQGGATITSGHCSITWTTSDDQSAEDLLVDIFFAPADSPDSWSLIATGIPNTGEYQWDVTGLQNGEYMIKIIVTDPLDDSTEVISDPFVIATVPETTGVIITPNPVDSAGAVFLYTLPESTATAKLLIFDAAGRLLFETPLDVSATRFPSAGTWNPVDQNGVPLANGPYIYVLVADGKVIGQGKMVIQR